MWKRLALVSLTVTATTALVQATLKPTLGGMVERSTVILVARMVEVATPDEALGRQVTIEPTCIPKGNLGTLPKRLTFTHTRVGKGNRKVAPRCSSELMPSGSAASATSREGARVANSRVSSRLCVEDQWQGGDHFPAADLSQGVISQVHVVLLADQVEYQAVAGLGPGIQPHPGSPVFSSRFALRAVRIPCYP